MLRKSGEIQEMDLRMTNRDVSLDAYINDDSGATHIDYLTYDGENQEAALIKKEETEIVSKHIAGALAKLSEKEEFIIKQRVMADNPMTLQEIGDRYKITRERARQIEKQALKKLRLSIPYTGETPALLEI